MRFSVLLLTSLAAACGQAEMIEAEGIEAQAESEEATVTASETAEPLADAEVTAGQTEAFALPLRRGFYVRADTACEQASNATLQLLHRDGINTSRVPCTFDKIEKTGANSYRVIESCTFGDPTGRTEGSVSTRTSTYEIAGETGVTIRHDGGGESTARYCPQSSLPAPWRDNDISGLIG